MIKLIFYSSLTKSHKKHFFPCFSLAVLQRKWKYYLYDWYFLSHFLHFCLLCIFTVTFISCVSCISQTKQLVFGALMEGEICCSTQVTVDQSIPSNFTPQKTWSWQQVETTQPMFSRLPSPQTNWCVDPLFLSMDDCDQVIELANWWTNPNYNWKKKLWTHWKLLCFTLHTINPQWHRELVLTYIVKYIEA